MHGDIVGIVDSAGNLVVEYEYDAWGKPIAGRSLTIAYETLGRLNPFRYRGYVYDEETGLYYLRSRYFNPCWIRFISTDRFFVWSKSIASHNLYLYCKNMPANNNDVDGTDFWSWLGDAWNTVCFEASTFFSAIEFEAGAGTGIGVGYNAYGAVDCSLYAGVDISRIPVDDSVFNIDQAIIADAGITVGYNLGLGISYRKPRDINDPYYDVPAEFDYTIGIEKNGFSRSGNKDNDFIIGFGVNIGLGLGGHIDISLNLTEWSQRRAGYYAKKHSKTTSIVAKKPKNFRPIAYEI